MTLYACQIYLSTHLDFDLSTYYTWFVPENTKTPAEVDASTGAEIPAAEAAKSLQLHYPAFGCGSQEEIHDDLPQLPDRS